MTANALASCVVRSSAAVVLTRALLSTRNYFNYLCPVSVGKWYECEYIFLHFLIKFSEKRVKVVGDNGCFKIWCLLQTLGGCFTNISRALQNNLAKIYNVGNHIYVENFKLKLCTCAQSSAFGTCTKFQREILQEIRFLQYIKFVRIFWRACVKC